jgi:opacity protein-like surface antigen
MTIQRIVLSALMTSITAISLASPVMAQTSATLRITRATVVLEAPRGDSIPVASVNVGDVLEVLGQQGNWYQVSAPDAPTEKTTWDRGWIHGSTVALTGTLPGAPEAARPPGRLLIRGFAQTGGTLFAARDSFDTILGRPFGFQYGAGGQVVFPNGLFAQVSVDRFRETGSRVLVSGTQIFTLDLPARITVTPVLLSAGYRSASQSRYAPYVGAGIGWHSLTEDSPALVATDRISERKIGYHVLGGVELPLARWVSLAGEAQWAAVPKGLGETGVSAVFGEDDLGGTTFSFKFIVGY